MDETRYGAYDVAVAGGGLAGLAAAGALLTPRPDPL